MSVDSKPNKIAMIENASHSNANETAVPKLPNLDHLSKEQKIKSSLSYRNIRYYLMVRKLLLVKRKA